MATVCQQMQRRTNPGSKPGLFTAPLCRFLRINPLAAASSVSVLAFLLAFCGVGKAQDGGVPDSAYTLSPQFTRSDCQGHVLIKVPVYYYGDQYHSDGHFDFTWSTGIECDTIIALGRWQQFADLTSISIDRNNRSGRILVSAFGTGFFPSGSGVVAEVWMKAALSDSFTLNFLTGPFPSGFWLQNVISTWNPTYQNLTVVISVPEMLPEIHGDVDCSAFVSISDAVFLISYIFAQGPEPVDLNMADPNQDCVVTVSDAVYLINYIFAGGNPPLPGCVN